MQLESLSKYSFATVCTIVVFLAGRKLAILETQLTYCDLSIRDKFIKNVVEHKHLREQNIPILKDLTTPEKATAHIKFTAFTADEIARASNSTYIFENERENSALFTVFKYLHHPGYPSDGEFIFTQENFWRSDFSTCDTVYATRSGARDDETNPATCVSIVRVPDAHGFHSLQAISHRNGTSIYPQLLNSQYQDDYFKFYMFPKQTEWTTSFLNSREELIDSFQTKVGQPFIGDKRRTVILMVANEGIMDFLLNYMCSAIAAKIDISNIVVFLGQEEYISLVESMGAKAFYHPALGSAPRDAAKEYADRTFTKLMWMKITSVYVALVAGFDVIFHDVDLVMIKDPVPHLQSLSEYDAIFMDDGARTLRFAPLFTNTGFYFLRNNEKTLYLQERLIRAAGEIDYTCSHQATFIRHLVETHYIFGLKVLILDDNEYPSGQMYHHQKDYVRKVQNHEKIPCKYLLHYLKLLFDSLILLNRCMAYVLDRKIRAKSRIFKRFRIVVFEASRFC